MPPSLVKSERDTSRLGAHLGLRFLVRAGVVGPSLLLLVLTLIVLAPALDLYDPYTQNIGARLLSPLSRGADGTLHILGTDTVGRDLFSRVVLAGRVTALIVLSALAIAITIGTSLGLLAGSVGGRIDSLIVSLADVQLAIPRMLLIIAVVAASGPSTTVLAILMGITSWVPYARITRAVTMSVKKLEYSQAALVMGARHAHMMRRHFFPSVWRQLVVVASLDIGSLVMLEASLSYLGLGIQPPLPSFGTLIAAGQSQLQSAAFLTVAPGLTVFALVLGVNLTTRRFTGEVE